MNPNSGLFDEKVDFLDFSKQFMRIGHEINDKYNGACYMIEAEW